MEQVVRGENSEGMKRNRNERVDAYIEAAPREARAKLLQLRRVIKATAAGVEEGISYRIPYYDYKGALVWFAAFKNHISIFIRPPVIEEHKHELKGYETTKSAVHFPMDKPLPVTLIRKLVKARIAKNAGALKKR
jgi:uncharacterized protein YdhG (YjbR/CyaY superfamily)